MKKKIIAMIAAISMLSMILTACSGSSSSGFSNKYGTSSTKCAVSGCSNYIASSGDTNCCASHSNKCLECRKYIDGDAMYCMSCLTSAAKKVSGSSGNSSKGY